MSNEKEQGTNIFSVITCIAIIYFIIKFCFFGGSLFSANGGKSSNLEVTESHFCSLGYGLTAICGTVVNKSNRNISYVQVEINLYDRNGNTVGSTSDTIDNLDGNATWKFRAPVVDYNVDNYKINNVSGL